jgi:aspartate-semialdehyde dehydrogenase
VAVVDGHTVAVSVDFDQDVLVKDALHAIQNFRGLPQERELPSAPANPLIYLPQEDRPQPRRDAGRERGMTTFVGRLRECPVLDLKFVACGHNTIRGAAGAAVLNAELMVSEGLIA